MVDLSVGVGSMNTWDDVLAKAARTGIDQSTLWVDGAGTVYGIDPVAGVVTLGNWAGMPRATNADRVSPGPDVNQFMKPGIGDIQVPLPGINIQWPNLHLPSLPWWVWVLIAAGVIVVLERN